MHFCGREIDTFPLIQDGYFLNSGICLFHLRHT